MIVQRRLRLWVKCPPWTKELISLFALLMLLAGCGSDGDDGRDGAAGADGYTAPKNVILFIGDGMHKEHELATSRYFYGNESGLVWQDQSEFPYQNYVTTWDVTTYNNYAGEASGASYDPDNFTAKYGYDLLKAGLSTAAKDEYFLAGAATDSASAGTAMATGVKTDAGNIAWTTGDPVGGELTTIGEYYRTRGGRYGVVSTVEFSHATPASFASHNVNRNNYQQIAHEIVAETRPDVVIGAGHPDFVGSDRYVAQADYTAIKADTEYVFVEKTTSVDGGTALLAAADSAVTQGKKLFGLFGSTQIATPLVTDTPDAPTFSNADETDPLLAESTEAAIKVLSQNGNSFFLMVEQGDIDWSNHANNFSGMVGGVIDLDRAVAKAAAMVENGDNGLSWNNTLVMVTSDHGNSYLRFNSALALGAGDLPSQDGSSYPDGEVFYGSGSHTNELVSLYAKGAGVDYLNGRQGVLNRGTDLLDNTDVYRAAKNAADLGYNVILFIGDGMQKAHEIAGSRYMYGTDAGLSFHNFDFTGYVTTWDVDTYNSYAAARHELGYAAATLLDQLDCRAGYDPAVAGGLPYPLIDTYLLAHATDSASAGTAISTGIKTDDGNISWASGDAADGMLQNVIDKVWGQRAGATGVVSTVEFSHATPATFSSHNINRNNYGEISEDVIFNVRPDVVIGAGHPAYNGTAAEPNYRYITKAAYQAIAADSEYVFVEKTPGGNGGTNLLAAADEAAAKGKKLFGLFGAAQIATPLVTDTPGSPSFNKADSEDPSLAESTTAALKVLSQDPAGFFLMVEQGDIDWSNHANNFSGMIGGVEDLEQAVKTAIDYVEQPGDQIDWSNTLLIVTSDHGNSFLRVNRALKPGLGDLPTQQEAPTECSYAYCGSYIYPDGDVFYATGGHTNELVSLYAKGYAAADLFEKYQGRMYPDVATRVIDNTDIFKVMAEFFGITLDQ